MRVIYVVFYCDACISRVLGVVVFLFRCVCSVCSCHACILLQFLMLSFV